MSSRRPAPYRQPASRGGAATRAHHSPASATREPVLLGVYQDMLRESGVVAEAVRQKRRKVEKKDDNFIDTAWPTAPETDVASSSKPAQELEEQSEKTVGKPKLVEEAVGGPSDDSDDDDDDQIDWEDVDLTKVLVPNPVESAILEVTLNDPSERKKSTFERKKITVVDRKIRLETHKLHLLCLMAHVSRRNKWCNNEQVQENLRRQFLHDTLIPNLDPAPQLSQLERNTRFLKGLTEAKNIWRKKFWITRRGLAKPYWLDMEDLNKVPPTSVLPCTLTEGLKIPQQGDGDPPMTKEDFIDATQKLTGSRDLGAQLFCALLRSMGVTARLVCSLQALPFSFVQRGTPSLSRFAPKTEEKVSALASTPKTPSKNSLASPVSRQYDPRTPAAQRDVLASLCPAAQMPVESPPRTPPGPARGTIMIKNESQYPVYWVEAWNMATQKWIPVDPLVLNKIGAASKFEPPQADLDNSMSYVVAFEEEGHVKDVTRRYTKNYNAKTRKLRVNATKGGDMWWLNLLQQFERGWDLDRDQVEDSELASKELGEGIPSSVADLKDHPLFALKRHLRRNEVIYPERPVSSFTTGTGSKAVVETVYRRQDVKVVRSPMQWYRLGREIKTGEQPLKHVARKRKRCGVDEEDDEAGYDNGETGLYAMFQTEEYVAPHVVDGMVPKNSFGNIDVYVPSMVPIGGIHVPHKDAVKAARIIGIDFAEAVTAFEYKGRQASAVIKGIVIAEEFRAALYAVLGALISEKEDEDAEKKALESLRLWKRFLLGLRIRERIEKEYGDVKEGEGQGGWDRERKFMDAGKGKGKERQVQRQSAEAEGLELEQDEEAGGFMRRDEVTEQREPISLRSFAKGNDETDGGSFIPEGNGGVSEGGGFLPEDHDMDAAGGFMSEGTGDSEGEGSIPEESGDQKDNSGDESILSEDPDIDNEDLDWF